MADLAHAGAGALDVDQEAIAFVQMLADELSSGQIELPSFPDVAVRVRRVLADEDVSTDKVLRVIGSEAALAANIMQMANSAALNRGGRTVSDLNSAISRIGFNLVRSAALVFAMSQMRRAHELAPVRDRLQEHWQRSNKVAAYCHVVAKRAGRINPDTALLAGLLHAVGRLYLIARSVKHPRLFADAAAVATLEREWAETIATSLLGNWGLEGEVLDAVTRYEDLSRGQDGAPNLTDVLTVAHVLASLHSDPDALEINLQNVKAATRLRLSRAALDELLQESDAEVVALQAALNA